MGQVHQSSKRDAPVCLWERDAVLVAGTEVGKIFPNYSVLSTATTSLCPSLLLPKARGRQQHFTQGQRMRVTDTDHWHSNQVGETGSESLLPTVPGTPRRCHLLRSLFLAILRGFGPKESACASPCLAWSSACYLRRQQTSAQAGVTLPSSAPSPQR